MVNILHDNNTQKSSNSPEGPLGEVTDEILKQNQFSQEELEAIKYNKNDIVSDIEKQCDLAYHKIPDFFDIIIGFEQYRIKGAVQGEVLFQSIAQFSRDNLLGSPEQNKQTVLKIISGFSKYNMSKIGNAFEGKQLALGLEKIINNGNINKF